MNQLLLAVILSVLPISELRGGLPVAVDYASRKELPLLPIFLLIVTANVVVIFVLFVFLDVLHKHCLRINIYKKLMNAYLNSIRKKTEKLQKSYAVYGFLALAIFVAIPLPATGAWTGTFIAWVLGLERKRSILAISAGVFVAGLVVLTTTLGVMNLVKLL